MSYVVDIGGYQGTIVRLLQEVNGHERDILELAISPIVDAFVATLTAERETLTLDQISEFLLVASILVELKSQRLLPGPEELEEDEELVGLEARDLLLARLLECRAYAGAADVFVALAEQASRSVPRVAGLEDDFVVHAPDLLEGVTAEDLEAAFRRSLVEPEVPQVDLSHVTVDVVTVAATVVELSTRLPTSGRTTFRELAAQATTRLEIIVCFLAVLELCKLGRVTLGQGETFGDLEVVWIGEDDLASALEHGEVAIDAYDG